MRCTTLPSVGRAVVGILKNPEQTANRYLYVASFETTQLDILKVLEQETGKKFEVVDKTGPELLKSGGEKMGKGDMSGFIDALQGTVVASIDKKEPLTNELVGLPDHEDITEVTRKVLDGSYS